MTGTSNTERAMLDATARELTAKGYDVIVQPSPNLLPSELSAFRPDAIALGREPKLIIEVTTEGSNAAEKVANLQRVLSKLPDWKLHLVVRRATSSNLSVVPDQAIQEILIRGKNVAQIDAQAALLLGWSAFEAIGRSRRPSTFARPQSPGRLIERLAAEGILTPENAYFLRQMAETRNAFIHGDLRRSVAVSDIEHFLSLLSSLLLSGDWGEMQTHNPETQI